MILVDHLNLCESRFGKRALLGSMGTRWWSAGLVLLLLGEGLQAAGLQAAAAELHGQQAVPIHRELLAQQAGKQSPELPDHVRQWLEQADALPSQGAYGKAAEVWEKVFRWSEKTLGPDHPTTAACLNILALLYYKQGVYPKAEPLFLRALAITEKVLGPDHPATAITLNNLGVLYANQGSCAKAEPFFLRAASISEKALGSKHPITIKIRESLKECRKSLRN